jgi:hypothetical protein
MTLTPHDPQLDIAARLLSSIVAQDRNRTLADRDEDLDHSLDLADELIRRYRSRKPQTPAPTLEPKQSTRVREVVIQRDEPTLSALLADRRRSGEESRVAPKPPGRTLH